MNVFTIHPEWGKLHVTPLWAEDPDADRNAQSTRVLPSYFANECFGKDSNLSSAPLPQEIIAEVNSGKWMILDTRNGLYDAYGGLGKLRHSGMMIIDEGLKDLIEELDPGMNEFVNIPKVWDATNNRKIHENFYLLNILRKVDCLDPELLNYNVAADGTPYYSTIGRGKIRRSTVGQFYVWRDAKTNDAYVSEEFKRRAEEVGMFGVRFSDPMRLVD